MSKHVLKKKKVGWAGGVEYQFNENKKCSKKRSFKQFKELKGKYNLLPTKELQK